MFGVIGKVGQSLGVFSSGGISIGTVGDEVITGVSTIRAGEQFTITGTGLLGATSVTINGVACTSVNVVSDATMTAIAPTDGFLHDELYTVEVL